MTDAEREDFIRAAAEFLLRLLDEACAERRAERARIVAMVRNWPSLNPAVARILHMLADVIEREGADV